MLLAKHPKVAELAGLTDPLGVISVYVTTEPSDDASERPAWLLRALNGLDRLRDEFERREGGREHDLALRERREDVLTELTGLMGSGNFGRGQALFFPLSSREVHRVSSQLPFGDLVMGESTPYLRPLLTAYASDAAAGIAIAGGDGLRVVDYRYGLAEDITQVRFDPPTSEWRELKGPAPSHPGRTQQVVSQTDLFDAKLAEHLKSFLATTHSTLERLAGERGWQFLVVAGEPQLREAITDNLAHDFAPRVVQAPRVIGPATASRAAEIVSADLGAARLRSDEELVERVESEKSVVRGLGETLMAVQQGQAEVVLISESGEWYGSRSNDGQFAPDSEIPPGAEPGELQPEPHMGERLIELAMRYDTAVAIIPDELAERIPDADGLAAILRW